MNRAEILKQVENKIKSYETYLTGLKKKTTSGQTKKPAK